MALTFTPEFLAQYDMLEPLGEGGMGTVYRGMQRSLERPVAIKFLSRQLLDDEYLARFRAEAKLAAQVFHTNLVAVIDSGQMGDVPFIVFELVEGASLREHARQAGGRLPVHEALDVVRQAAEGLARAHQMGIIHRDIKPENVLVAPARESGAVSASGMSASGASGRVAVKVADFGVAKDSGKAGSQKTRSGVIMGTPAYMSPEQAREQELTPSSDIYALGVVLHELLAGELPFRKPSTLELLQAIVSEPPPPLPDDVPAPVAELVERMLAKEPVDRPASMTEVAGDLAQLSSALSRAPARRAGATGSHATAPRSTNTVPVVREAKTPSVPASSAQTSSTRTRPTGTRPAIEPQATRPVTRSSAPAALAPPGVARAPLPGGVRGMLLACALTAVVCTAGASAWFRAGEPSRRRAASPSSPRPVASRASVSPAVTPPPASPDDAVSPAATGSEEPDGSGSGSRPWLGRFASGARRLGQATKERVRSYVTGGVATDETLADFACGGPDNRLPMRQHLCETWSALDRRDPATAVDHFARCLTTLHEKTRRPPVKPLLPVFHARVLERLAVDLFARPRAESILLADRLVAATASGPLRAATAGLRTLVGGGPQLLVARAELVIYLSSNVPDLLAPQSGAAVLAALAFAASLPAGWSHDPEQQKYAQLGLASCEKYLEVWKQGELRGVAAQLAIGMAGALGRATPAGSGGAAAPIAQPRLAALVATARAHLAAGAAGSALPPDPVY